MRISVDENDPGYRPDYVFDACVLLDGELVPDCITADEAEGMVVVYQRDAQTGRIAVVGDDALRETKYGKVSIFFPAQGIFLRSYP